MTNATVTRTTRAVYSDPYNTQSFFVGPGTRCFVNPLTYKPDGNGNIAKRVPVEVLLEDGRRAILDYLLPETSTTFFRTVVFDKV